MTVFAILLVIFLLASIAFGAPLIPSHSKDIDNLIKWLKDNNLSGETFIDLGSGSGKVVKKFRKEGFIANGIEVNPLIYLISRVSNKDIYFGNYLKFDFSKYSIIYLFSSSIYLKSIRAKIEGYRPKCVLSYGFKLSLDDYSEHMVSGYYCYLKN